LSGGGPLWPTVHTRFLASVVRFEGPGRISAIRITTLNISLPRSMRAFIERECERRGFTTASEYMRSLIREAQVHAGGRDPDDPDTDASGTRPPGRRP
jgi:hypothetical protein